MRVTLFVSDVPYFSSLNPVATLSLWHSLGLSRVSGSRVVTSENAYFLSKNMLENPIFFRGGSAPSTPARGLHGRPLGTPAGSF